MDGAAFSVRAGMNRNFATTEAFPVDVVIVEGLKPTHELREQSEA